MPYGRVSNRYQRTAIETAGKLDLVVMCYEKVIQCLNQAKAHLQEKEYEKKAEKIQRVLDILTELQSSLDFEKGGQIAKNLDALYSYMLKRIVDGDIRKDPAAMDEVIRMMVDLKAGWEGIASDGKTEEKTASAPQAGERQRAQIAA